MSRAGALALARRLGSALVRERALVFVGVVALGLRVYWNLAIHAPTANRYSDMAGYIDRASEIFDDAARAHAWLGDNWQPRPHTTVFPWGTHGFVFVVKLFFGLEDPPVDVAFAALGAAGVVFAHATARRLWPRRPLLTFSIGALLALYFPWIVISSYALSEVGFTACLGATTWLSLRLVDRGRARDAWWLGAALAAGAAFRPQMLLGAAILFAIAALRRRRFPRLQRRFALYVAAPILLVLALSSARVAYHNRSFGLVSTNGPVNFLFGRCHAPGLETVVAGGRGFFGPPPFGQMLDYQKHHRDMLFKLDPVVNKAVVRGYMWSSDAMYAYARDCVEKTGWAKQAYFSLTHVVMLFAYNEIWPGMHVPRFRRWMPAACRAILLTLPVPLLLGVLSSLRRRGARELLLTAHVVAMTLTAIIYFGDTRLRAAYDGVAWTLALGAVFAALGGARRAAASLLRWRS